LERVSVSAVDADGGEVEGLLEDLTGVAFEHGRPVRSIPSYRGQRNFPGLYFAACCGRHIGFESWLERDEAMALDFDPVMVAFAAQPFRLKWPERGGGPRHTPDFFARRVDGAGVVIDCRPADRIGPGDREVFAATELACRSVGWEFRLVTGHDPVWLGNVRWLAGYRQARFRLEPVASQLIAAFARSAPLAVTAGSVGDPIAVLPVAYHLLWSGALNTDLAVRLDGSAVVTAS
jgi:hypothetical protein